MAVKVAFLGGGSFGSSLGVMLTKKGIEVSIYDRDKSVIDDINIKRENIKYLHGITIPHSITAYLSLEEAVKDCNFIVFAVPSHVIRRLAADVSKFVKRDQILVSIAKGIEENTFKRLSEVINEEIPNNSVVVLSGPSHAEEVAGDIPTVVAVASKDMSAAEKVQDLFMTNKFRVYTNEDLVGVEIGGAVKNIIALAAGVSDGIGYGDNTKAALMTRGMSEIIRIGTKLGGKQETFSGLTGFGDLIVTCTSMHSRNRRAGILIGQGVPVEDAIKQIGMIVEGIKACNAFYKLKESLGVDMPITDVLYKVLYEGKEPKYGVYELMSRDKKDEIF